MLQLCRLLDLRKVPQGTVVCRRGEKCESMFFVVRGWVDEIKYFKIEETNKWATDLGRTQFVENTQARSVSAVVNQLGPKSCVPRALAPYDCRRGGSLLRLWSCVCVEQILWAGVHAGEGSSVSEHDEMSQRVSLAPASPGRPDGTRVECREGPEIPVDLHVSCAQGTVDVHTLNSLRERITVDPVTEEQYEKLCKTRFEMERLRHSLVTDIMTTKRVKKQPPTYLPTRTHIGTAVRCARHLVVVNQRTMQPWMTRVVGFLAVWPRS